MGLAHRRKGGPALGKWAEVTTAHARITLIAGTLLTLVALLVGHGAGRHLDGDVEGDPRADSSIGARLLRAHFPAAQSNLTLLVSTPGKVDSPTTRLYGRRLTKALTREPGVQVIASYGDQRRPDLMSADGHHALILAHVDESSARLPRTLDAVSRDLESVRGRLEVRMGGSATVGQAIQDTILHDLGVAELMAFPVVIALLLLVSRSVVAAALPLLIAVFAVEGANALLRALAPFTSVSVFALNLTTALGIGLAVDYGLLLVRRYREEVLTYGMKRDAVIASVGQAGHTIVVSAAILVSALTTLLLFPLPFLRSMAYAGIATVTLAAFATVTLLPPVLVQLGQRIDTVGALPRARSPRHAVPSVGGEGWVTAVRWTARHALAVASTTTIVLVLFGAPFLHARFDVSDVRQLPSRAQARIAEERITSVFPTQSVDIILASADQRAVAGYARRLSTFTTAYTVDAPTGRYAHGLLTGPPQPARSSGGSSWISVSARPRTPPAELETLVRRLRDVEAPADRHVTGVAAINLDTRDSIREVLPYAAIAAVTMTLLLILRLTRSPVLTVQAVLLNALSLAAMLGAQVWWFQDGSLAQTLGFTPTGSLDIGVSVLMGVLAFGLSMDYGIFLVSRLAEERRRRLDPYAALEEAVRTTGGTISSAAVILAASMLAVAGSRITSVKMLGIGVALAVLLDAMVVRALLLPSVLALGAARTRLTQARADAPESQSEDQAKPQA